MQYVSKASYGFAFGVIIGDYWQKEICLQFFIPSNIVSFRPMFFITFCLLIILRNVCITFKKKFKHPDVKLY